MTGSVTVYFNTGFNGIDIPSSPTVLASATKKVYTDVFYMREDIDKPTIRIKDTYENLCAVDYCAITTGTGTSAATRYFFASPSALTKGVTMLALDLDALLTMGGAENLNYISGWQERGHIAKADDVLFGNVAAEEWVPVQPLVNANTVDVKSTKTHDPSVDFIGRDLKVLYSNIDLSNLGDVPSEQDVIAGVENGDAVMYVPKIETPTAHTAFWIYDFDVTPDPQDPLSSFREFHLPLTAAYAQENPADGTDIPKVRQGISKLFSCGQLQLQGSYIIPQEYVNDIGSFSSATGFFSNITGIHESIALSTLPYEYTIGTGQSAYTPKNKKVFATYRQFALAAVASGDTCVKDVAELYQSGDSYPTVDMWSDCSSTGKPYAKFHYLKGSPLHYMDCVRGLQWANGQLVLEGASGSMWNSINNAFANQQLQRQQSENLFNNSVALEQGSIKAAQVSNQIDQGVVNNTIDAITGGVDAFGQFAGDFVKGDLSGAWGHITDYGNKTVKSLANQYYGAKNTELELQAMRSNINATTARAEMANNSIQNQINQNNIGLLRANRAVAPTVMFTPEQNLGLYGYNYFVAFEIRKSDDDLKSEDMYYQRYGYNGLHRPLTQQAFKERTYYNFVQAFDINLKAPVKEFGLRVRTKAIAQLNKGVRVWRVLPDPQYYETN